MRKKLGVYLLTSVIVLGSISIDWNHVSAKTEQELQQEIDEANNKLSSIKEQNQEIQNSKSETQDKIDENLGKQSTVKNQIAELDEKLAETQELLDAKQGEIDTTNNEINKLTARIDDLTAQIEQLKSDIMALLQRIDDREELLAERLRSLQKSGGPMMYLEVLLGSTSFSDFITRTAAVNVMMDKDQEIIDSLAKDKNDVKSKKLDVEDSKKEVENNKLVVEDKKAKLVDQKQELVVIQDQLDGQKAERKKLLAQLEKEQHHLEDYMFTLEDEQAMLKKQQQAVAKARELAQQNLNQLSGSTDSTGFIWPASGYRSSNYGGRIDPINHINDFHLGIDIANKVGTPVYAATNGVAVRGNLSGTYGNHILIVTQINGVDFTTLYAHLSRFAISDGEAVRQGQLIGYMGQTGRVTGPHLHFEVHKGGWIGFYPPNSNVVNPLNYLP